MPERLARIEVAPEQVAEALRDVSRIGGFFALDTAPTRTSDGDARLARAGFAERAQAVNDHYRTPEPRIGVSIAHLGLAARLWSPVLACALVHGIVPTMSTVEWSGQGSALRLPRPEGRRAAELPHSRTRFTSRWTASWRRSRAALPPRWRRACWPAIPRPRSSDRRPNC